MKLNSSWKINQGKLNLYTGGKLILVVAESLRDIEILSTLLKRENYVVQGLQNHLLNSNAFEKKSPDLIILDLDIKKIEYFLKSNGGKRETPIIFVNALKDSEAVTNALHLGCEDFVTKPINPTELSLRVRTQIGLNSMRKRLEYVNLALEESVMNRTKELEETNKRLRVSEERWQFALEGSGDGVWDWNLHTNEVFFSRRWKEMLGYSEYDTWDTYEEWTRHIHPDDVGWVTDAIQWHLSGNSSSYQSEHRVIRKDGSYIWVLSRGKVIKSFDGKPSRMVGTHTDISERKKIERNLHDAKAEAEIANRLKSQFLANMSHEIRTPLNAVLGFAEILKDKVGDKHDLLEYVLGIQKSGRNLLNLINDILDIAKIEAGRLEIKYSPVNLIAIINDIKQIFSIQTSLKRLKFEITIDDHLPPVILMDELRLRQILFNLIGNAIKFTEKGGVDVNVRAINKKESENKIDIIFEIKDTGIGIAPRDIGSIFEPFKQQQGQDNLRYGGSGLGLSIAKRLVEMMNGSITLDSEVGKGSKFTFIMPNTMISNQPIEKNLIENFLPEKIEFISAKILLVEDNEANRQVVIGFLENTNLKVSVAENGKIALEMLEKEKFDLILMDMNMPTMGGKETSLYIKQNELNKQIPIIALTAMAMEEDRADIMTFVNSYISKPIDRSGLFMEIAKYIPSVGSENNEDNYDYPYRNFIINLDFLIQENQISEEFISHYKTWYLESEIARKSLNTNRLKAFIFELRELSQSFNIQIFIDYSNYLIQLLNSFTIDKLSIALGELDQAYGKLK